MARREEMRQELEKRRIEAERKERERLAELERNRREALIGQAQGWRTAEDLRAFVALAMAKLGDENATVRRWRDWALAVADRLDPLTTLTSFELPATDRP